MRWFCGQMVSVVMISGLIGCGFTPGAADGTTGGAGGSGDSSGTGASSGSGGVNGGGGSLGVGLTGGGGDVGFGTGGTPMTCGQMSVGIMPLPPDILILQDRSLSMVDDPTGATCPANSTTCSKWSQVSTAIAAVLTSTAGASVNWGLKFFASDTQCTVSAGADVDVGAATTSVPAIQAAFQTSKPQSYTPTSAALNASVTYLQGVQDTNPRYILLATDGLPNCMGGTVNMNDDSMAAEAAVSAAVTAGFKVFVVGIGNTMGDATLNQMAMNGGEAQTGAATSFYSVADTTSLETALETIIGKVASCNVSLATAPTGFTNVAVSAEQNGMQVKVPEDPTNGWSYNADMTEIILNGTACADLQNNTYSNFQFVYSCPTGTICIDKLADGTCGDAP
jgi:von Willebrand factor type A domain